MLFIADHFIMFFFLYVFYKRVRLLGKGGRRTTIYRLICEASI